VPAQKNQAEKDSIELLQKVGHVEITYYTDPLCCWSWAFEPEWQKLKLALSGRLKYRYCMGGLLPSWKNFHDVFNSVSRPVQMGPVWMHAAEVSGMKIQNDIWVKDPPASSYPACFAFKCAESQSADAGEKYLQCLRRACMLESRNIAKKDVLLELAFELAKDKTIKFNYTQFERDMANNRSLDALRKDLNETASFHITRFPTLVIKTQTRNAKLITGYNKYERVCRVITS